MVVSVAADSYQRIEHYALTALLGDEHISIDLEIAVAVAHLAAFNNRIELTVGCKAYVIFIGICPPIAEATVIDRLGVGLHKEAGSEVVAVAYVVNISVAQIPEAYSCLCLNTAKRVDIAEYVLRAGLGALNAVIYRCDTHIGEGVIGSLNENAYRLSGIVTRNVYVINVYIGSAESVGALLDVYSNRGSLDRYVIDVSSNTALNRYSR